MPKRYGNLFEQIVSEDNVRQAHYNARRGKKHYREVKRMDRIEDRAIRKLAWRLQTQRFTTSKYEVETRVESGKERVIHKLPYYPDRVVHHALCQVCNPIWERSLIRDTYQSIPGRGLTDARQRITRALRRDRPNYALHIDIHNFYPSVPGWWVKAVVRRRIKCRLTLALIDDIINSSQGLALGNYPSQIWGNLVLSPLDWFIKQTLRVKHYFRYCDDLVLMADNIEQLREWEEQIRHWLNSIKLDTKPSRTIELCNGEALDFCGYQFRYQSLDVRPSIKDRYQTVAVSASSKKGPLTNRERSQLGAYWGWYKPSDNRGEFLDAYPWHRR